MPTPKNPTVSVAIATYNGEKFFFEQLESIRNQTVLPREIVISDDNSSDNTLAIIDLALPEKWRQDNGVGLKVLRNAEALGPGKNFEQAILSCTSDFIACADQDDLWVPHKLEVLLDAFSKHPEALLVHSDAELVDSTGAPLGMTLSEGLSFSEKELFLLDSGHSLPAIIKRNLVTGATMMVKKELVQMAFPIPRDELHDGRLALVASLLDAIVFVPEKLIHYRQHDGNQIGGKPMGLLDSFVAVQKSWVEMAGVLAAHNADHRQLLERLGDLVPPRNQEIVHERITHNTWRIGLPKSRLFRVWPVVWGVIQGRYARYGRQPHDVLRDLLMPPREILLGLYRAVVQRKR
jgi:glycosyltransferase involved in cell wall biosynthesis